MAGDLVLLLPPRIDSSVCPCSQEKYSNREFPHKPIIHWENLLHSCEFLQRKMHYNYEQLLPEANSYKNRSFQWIIFKWVGRKNKSQIRISLAQNCQSTALLRWKQCQKLTAFTGRMWNNVGDRKFFNTKFNPVKFSKESITSVIVPD